MTGKHIIAIDGPAGAGKSTIAKILAKKLGYTYIDSGAMYRALTFKAMKLNYDLRKARPLVVLARHTRLEFRKIKSKVELFMDGRIVGNEIRSPEVTANICYLADNPGVRPVMVKLQQKIARRGGIVMEGRDIGTKVFPRAKIKFYLDASVQERARRRFLEFRERRLKISMKTILKDIRIRDRKDKTRHVSPLRRAKDALVVDSSRLTPAQVVAKMLTAIKEK